MSWISEHRRKIPLSVALIYAVFSLLWIFFSDRLIWFLASDVNLVVRYSILKGFFFVAVTTLILFWQIKRFEIKLSKLIDESISQKQKAEHSARLYAVLSNINRAILHEPDRQILKKEVCRIMVDVGGFSLAWFGTADKDGWIQPVASYGTTAYLEGLKVSCLDIPEGAGPTGMAMRENRHFVNNDTSVTPIVSLWKQHQAEYGIDSSAAFPVALPDGSISVLTLYSNERGFFTETEIKLLNEVVSSLSFGLAQIEKSRILKVRERTIREIIDNLPSVLYLFDRSNKAVLVNRAMADLFGLTPSEFEGKTRTEFGISEEAARQHEANDRSVIEAGTPVVMEETNLQDDVTHTYLSVKFPLTNEKNEIWAVGGISTDITEQKKLIEKSLAEKAQIIVSRDELSLAVAERTKELEIKNAELERMNNLFVGRELKMMELKQRIKDLGGDS